LSCNTSFTAPTATDACSTATVNVVIDVTTPAACAGTYSRTITWDATDGCGNHSTQVSQTITVQDIVAPVLSGCSGPISLPACTPTASWATPTAIDGCSGATVTQIAGPSSGSTFANGTSTTIKYKATDACGNVSYCSFTVTRAPELVATCGNTNPVLYFGYMVISHQQFR
jgi:hypothetical protein